MPVIYFEMRRKVGTNKFDLVVVESGQVSLDSGVDMYKTQICKGKFEQVRKTNLVPAANHH